MAKQLRRNTLTKKDDVLARVEAGVGNAYELVDELAEEVERLRMALALIVHCRIPANARNERGIEALKGIARDALETTDE